MGQQLRCIDVGAKLFMDVYLVFNELCLQRPRAANPEVNKHTAHSWMQQFGDVITRARRYGIKALRVNEGFFNLELVPDYKIADWTRNREIDRELTQRIRSAATAYDELTDGRQTIEDKELSFDFRYQGERADGLGYAILLESIAVSLDTESCWQTHEIEVEVEELREVEDDLKIVSTTERSKHASHPDHLDNHRDWVQTERYATGIQNGINLLSKLNDWFPDLVFIAHVQEQIKGLNGGTPQLRQIVCRLFELNNYCQSWNSGGFDKTKLRNVSPEGKTVRADADLRNKRVFKLPDGREEFFEWHLRLTPDAWRLYFLPDAVNRRFYIGYVGPHLPTKKYK